MEEHDECIAHERSMSVLDEVEARLQKFSITGNMRDDAELEEYFDKVYRRHDGHAESSCSLSSAIPDLNACSSFANSIASNASSSSSVCSDTASLYSASSDVSCDSDKSRKMDKLERLRLRMAKEQRARKVNDCLHSTDSASFVPVPRCSERSRLLAGLGI